MPDIIETTDAPQSTSTPYTLLVGQTAQGTLAVGDSDWYRVNLVAGHTYTFAEVGTGNASANLRDPFMYLRDSSGTILAGQSNPANPNLDTDDAGPGTNSAITFTATYTGSYYIDAGSYNLSLAGQYGLSVTEGTMANFDEEMVAGILLRQNASWSTPGTGANVTWAARETFPGAFDAQNNPATFSQITAAQIEAVRNVLQNYAEVSGLTFTQVNPSGYSDNATMLVSNYTPSQDDGAGAFGIFPVGTPGDTSAASNQGDLCMNTNGGPSSTDIPLGSYSWFVMIHELGHALGLPHPGDYNAAPGQNITYATTRSSSRIAINTR